MATTLPTRNQIEQAGDLDFDRPGRGQPAHIAIELAPDGVRITVSYDGQISGIPTAIERLRAAGLLDLVAQHRAAPASAPRKAAETVEPIYKPDGTPCCPVHHKPLTEGQYGLYCSARAQAGQQANAKGYCSLRFD